MIEVRYLNIYCLILRRFLALTKLVSPGMKCFSNNKKVKIENLVKYKHYDFY